MRLHRWLLHLSISVHYLVDVHLLVHLLLVLLGESAVLLVLEALRMRNLLPRSLFLVLLELAGQL